MPNIKISVGALVYRVSIFDPRRDNNVLLVDIRYPSINTNLKLLMQGTISAPNNISLTTYQNDIVINKTIVVTPCKSTDPGLLALVDSFNNLAQELNFKNTCQGYCNKFIKTRVRLLKHLGISSFKDIHTRYTADYNTCLELAQKYHANQVDKAGKPYINHPLYVANCFSDSFLKSAAILHDILEDTECTPMILRQHYVPQEVISTIQALSRSDGMSYGAYIDSLADNKYAILIKLADLQHNMDLSRLTHFDTYAVARSERYSKAIARLLQIIQERGYTYAG